MRSSTKIKKPSQPRLSALTAASGSALAICLIFLLLVTILGMSVVRSATVQEKMAANIRDKDLAFQAAETALKVAETLLATTALNTLSFTDDCANGLCAPLASSALASRWDDTNACGSGLDIWSCDKSRALSGSDALDGNTHAKQPRFFVEVLDDLDTADGLNMVNIGDAVMGDAITVYRITAIGYGGSANAKSLLQSTYAK